jgi:hypothetical protein
VARGGQLARRFHCGSVILVELPPSGSCTSGNGECRWSGDDWRWGSSVHGNGRTLTAILGKTLNRHTIAAESVVDLRIADRRRRPLALGWAPKSFGRIVSARQASHWRRWSTKFARSEIHTSGVAASRARQCRRRHTLNTADEKRGVTPCRARINPIRADVASDSDIRYGSSGEGSMQNQFRAVLIIPVGTQGSA